MATPASAGSAITHEEKQRVVDWIRDQGKTPVDVTRSQISDAFDITDRRARTILDELRLTWGKWSTPIVDAEGGESHDVKGDSWAISIPKTRICTIEQLLEHCKVDLSVWTVDRYTINKWEVGVKDADGAIQVEPLYQVKAWLKRNAALDETRQRIAELIECARDHAPKYKPFRYKPTSGNLLEVDIFDAHFGKLAWGAETGHADYDIRIAEERFHEAIETLIARTQHHGIDRILFPIGNDLQQTDTRAGTTTSGTYVDTDSRFKKTFRATHRIQVEAIDRLSAIAPVDVVIVPGNHDELAAWTLGFALECWYRNCPNVTVDNTPPLRKYYEWGKCMQMFAHGHKGKHREYGFLMATERPEMFGRTRYREAHVGHFHGDKVLEKFGVIVRQLRALCPPDAWHSDNHFVSNSEGAEAFLWNREEGLIATAMYTVRQQMAAAS